MPNAKTTTNLEINELVYFSIRWGRDGKEA